MLGKKQSLSENEKAVLVGLITTQITELKVLEYLEELAFLATAAGAKTQKVFFQKLTKPDTRTFIGKGKLAEIAEYIRKCEIDILIFDDELSPGQLNNIQREVKIKVIDRPSLILDIFARRARTAQAKVQVELAQYQYLLPRLKGFWSHLERQGGGIGTRGPGETEIETDRRIVQDKIALLKKHLSDIARQTYTQRKSRGAFIRVALVGYTNVGKSTLMNVLGKSEVLVENKLFATLDTTTRKIVMDHTPFLLSDTVGFIRKLPHHLVESFKSTLEEVRESDLLLHVVDISHPGYEEHITIVQNTLKELGVMEKKIIIVLNKVDLYIQKNFDEWTPESLQQTILREIEDKMEHTHNLTCILLAAHTKYNLTLLKMTVLVEVRKLYSIKYPYKTMYFY